MPPTVRFRRSASSPPLRQPRKRRSPRQLPPPAMRLLLRRPSVLLLAAALAALAITGTAGAKSFTLAAGGRFGAGREGRQPPRRRAASRTPSTDRSAAATARSRCAPASRSTASGSPRTARAYRPGGCTELGCSDAPGTFGTTRVGHTRPHRLALRGTRRAPHLHDALSPEGRRGCLRRRRRRQPPGVGLRVEASRSAG